MGDLKKWIEAQLKRGYKAKQIKQLLASKGYPQSAVAEVDKVIYSTSPRKKIPKKVPYKPITLISIVIGIALVAWLISAAPFFSKQQENINELGVAEIRSDDLCKGFKDAGYTTSCEEAVALALDDSPGVVEKVSIGPSQIRNPSADIPKLIEKETWLVDIRLETPQFNEALEKEVRLLRIGIGLNEGVGIQRRPLE